MAYTSPKTWGVGEVATSSDLNEYVRDNIKALGESVVGTSPSAIASAVGATDGLRMRLRIGSSPFDFVTLTYDATYGKWVSEPIGPMPIWNAGGEQTVTDITSVGEIGGGVRLGASFDWKAYSDAGLTLQHKFTATLHSSVGASKACHAQLAYAVSNFGGTWGNFSFIAGTDIATPSSDSVIESLTAGWQSLTAPAFDRMTFSVGAYRDPGGGGIAVGVSYPSVALRFVV